MTIFLVTARITVTGTLTGESFSFIAIPYIIQAGYHDHVTGSWTATVLLLISYLYSSFRQVDSKCQFFPHENIRVVSLLEGSFQFFQLHAGKRRSVSALLLPSSRHDAGIMRVGRRLVRVMTHRMVAQSRSWRHEMVMHSHRHRRRYWSGHQRLSLFCWSKPREPQYESTDERKRKWKHLRIKTITL